MKILAEEVKVERMVEEHLPIIADFQSFESDLTKFLTEDAFCNQQRKISVTYLWFVDSLLVGYLTLLNDRIHLEGDLKKYFSNKGIYYNSLPALKIGRLCVDDRFRGKGIGTLIIKFAIRKAEQTFRQIAGCKFITVEAKRESLQFYEKSDFIPLQDKIKEYIPMYFIL